jgi:hypothetical protein
VVVTATGGVRLTDAVELFVVSATLVALIVTVCTVVMVLGAVYFAVVAVVEIVPTAGLRVQVTF